MQSIVNKHYLLQLSLIHVHPILLNRPLFTLPWNWLLVPPYHVMGPTTKNLHSAGAHSWSEELTEVSVARLWLVVWRLRVSQLRSKVVFFYMTRRLSKFMIMESSILTSTSSSMGLNIALTSLSVLFVWIGTWRGIVADRELWLGSCWCGGIRPSRYAHGFKTLCYTFHWSLSNVYYCGRQQPLRHREDLAVGLEQIGFASFTEGKSFVFSLR